jgi:hypothetical protein
VALDDLVEGGELGAVWRGLVGHDGLGELEDFGVDGHLEVEGAAVGNFEAAG